MSSLADDAKHPTRRRFLATAGAVTGLAASKSVAKLGAQGNKNSHLQILQIGTGGIGEMDRREIAKHPKAKFVGFCDINRQILDAIKTDYPDAFTLTDYREAFAQHLDQFDAVVVNTPDFHHAPMLLTAMQHHKHVYGQKPLVHQLDEIRLVRDALKKRPDLVTQMGNQRASVSGRMQAVEVLKNNQLGRPVEAHVWTGELRRDSHFAAPWSPLPAAQPIPDHIDWDSWNGPLTTGFNYNEDDLYPRRWRAYWDTGSGQLGDWGCHLMDALYYAFDLPSPEAVLTDTSRAANTGHSAFNISTLTFPGGGERFAQEKFVVRYCDSMVRPSFAALGMPAIKPGVNNTLVVCEDGCLLLGDLGKIDVFRNGKSVDERLPEVEPCNHWSDWVERCLGGKKPLQSPFDSALRITEATLLTVKATRFPRLELRWDGPSYRFTNPEAANEHLLKRDYRAGFAPPEITT